MKPDRRFSDDCEDERKGVELRRERIGTNRLEPAFQDRLTESGEYGYKKTIDWKWRQDKKSGGKLPVEKMNAISMD